MGFVGRCGSDGAAQGGDEVTFLENDEVVERELEIVGEGFAQGGEEGERTAAEQDGGGEIAAVAERGDGLHGDAVEDARSDIALGQVARHEVLDVGLGEYAASGGHRVEVGRLHGEVVHLLVAAAHEHRHLVDEGTRTTGAVAVHAQLHRLAVEEHHFGVLTADIDERLGLGITVAGEDGGRYDLLYECGAQLLGRGHAHRTGDAQTQADVAQLTGDIVEIFAHQFGNLSIVALVA